jgi:tetraacyldisaccharide 4'-kinase
VIRAWTSDAIGFRLLRTALAPAAGLYGAAVAARRTAYQRGWLVRSPLPRPSVGIGAVQVGGAGKTPIASWIGSWYASRGVTPAILLRGYGGDEGLLHRALGPSAIVVEDADRLRGAARAVALGADVLVLDDAFQHLRVRPDRQLVLVPAEAFADSARQLPAGPWRERLAATRDADLLVVTHKTAEMELVERARAALRRVAPHVPQALAWLAFAGWRTLEDELLDSTAVRPDTAVLGLSGIADARPFLAELDRRVRVRRRWTLRDHARYGTRRIIRIARAAEKTKVDYVVTTAKDAVKLRGHWPDSAPPVLVVDLAVTWQDGHATVAQILEACRQPHPTRAELEERLGSATRTRVAEVA